MLLKCLGSSHIHHPFWRNIHQMYNNFFRSGILPLDFRHIIIEQLSLDFLHIRQISDALSSNKSHRILYLLVRFLTPNRRTIIVVFYTLECLIVGKISSYFVNTIGYLMLYRQTILVRFCTYLLNFELCIIKQL